MPPNKEKKRRQKRQMKWAVGGITVFAVILIIIGVSVYSPYSPFYMGETTTIPADESSITLYSRVDGEDVSFVEVDIWVPTDDAIFDSVDDIYDMDDNFEVLGTTQEAVDVDDDLSEYAYIWIEVDPDGISVFENQFFLVSGNRNFDFTGYINHLTSDVNFNMIDDTTLGAITVADYQTDGNYTVIFDCPHYTTSDIHANTADWAIDEDIWDDMSASNKEFYYDEANFRNQAAMFNPETATEAAKLHMDYDLSDVTSAFALQIVCNETVDYADETSTTAINITITENINGNVYRVNDDENIYLVFDGDISFENGIQSIGLEIEFGSDITLSDMNSGRITVPGHIYTVGSLSFVEYSGIGT